MGGHCVLMFGVVAVAIRVRDGFAGIRIRRMLIRDRAGLVY